MQQTRPSFVQAKGQTGTGNQGTPHTTLQTLLTESFAAYVFAICLDDIPAILGALPMAIRYAWSIENEHVQSA